MNEAKVTAIVEAVKGVLNVLNCSVPVGVSNRHVHLSQADMEVLFGEGHELEFMKELKQPGQYAAKETVTLEGPKGKLERVRILGPIRPSTQIEISISDGFKLGVSAPVRPSGKLEGSPGIRLVGPEGHVDLPAGVIVAHRHIHMHTTDAKRMGIEDGMSVCVKSSGPRAVMFENVTCRVSEKYALELHLDMDEANAGGIRNGDLFEILR